MPATNVDPCIKVNVAVVIVEASIVSLKVAAIFLLKPTPVALFAGSVNVTVGGMMTAAAPVASAAHPSVPGLASVVLVPSVAAPAVFVVPIACPRASAVALVNSAAVAPVSAVDPPSSGPVSCPAGSVDSAAVVVAVSLALRASSLRSHD